MLGLKRSVVVTSRCFRYISSTSVKFLGSGHGHDHDHSHGDSHGHHDDHDDHHHGPNLPPFARQRPPSYTLPIELENVWDDSVAPETAIDFDAPHIDTKDVFIAWGIAASLFYGLYLFISWTDPEGSNPVAPRMTVLDNLAFQRDFGQISEEEYLEKLAASEHGEGDGEEDE